MIEQPGSGLTGGSSNHDKLDADDDTLPRADRGTAILVIGGKYEITRHNLDSLKEEKYVADPVVDAYMWTALVISGKEQHGET